MKCPGCGALNVDSAVECEICGRPLPPAISAEKGGPPPQGDAAPQPAADIIERIEHAPKVKPSRLPYVLGGVAAVVLVVLLIWLRSAPKGLSGTWTGTYLATKATLTLKSTGECKLEPNGRPAREGKWRTDGEKVCFSWNEGAVAEEEWWYKLSEDGDSLSTAVCGVRPKNSDKWKRSAENPPAPDSRKWHKWQRVAQK